MCGVCGVFVCVFVACVCEAILLLVSMSVHFDFTSCFVLFCMYLNVCECVCRSVCICEVHL